MLTNKNLKIGVIHETGASVELAQKEVTGNVSGLCMENGIPAFVVELVQSGFTIGKNWWYF